MMLMWCDRRVARGRRVTMAIPEAHNPYLMQLHLATHLSLFFTVSLFHRGLERKVLPPFCFLYVVPFALIFHTRGRKQSHKTVRAPTSNGQREMVIKYMPFPPFGTVVPGC